MDNGAGSGFCWGAEYRGICRKLGEKIGKNPSKLRENFHPTRMTRENCQKHLSKILEVVIDEYYDREEKDMRDGWFDSAGSRKGGGRDDSLWREINRERKDGCWNCIRSHYDNCNKFKCESTGKVRKHNYICNLWKKDLKMRDGRIRKC